MAGPEARATRPTVLFAGRISPEKGAGVLIDVARRVPDVELRLAGTGPDEAELKRRSEDLTNVHWLGHLDAAALERERAQAWTVAVPSLWYENAPLSVIESFCAGRPVLVADHGGLVEMVDEGTTGWRLPPGDVDAWAAAFQRLPAAASELMLMGTRARAVADRDHDHEQFLDAHVALYTSLTAAPGAAEGATR